MTVLYCLACGKPLGADISTLAAEVERLRLALRIIAGKEQLHR
jgi:hypothetical protein